jgi:polysaccharide biosynthesis/export protein PslD
MLKGLVRPALVCLLMTCLAPVSGAQEATPADISAAQPGGSSTSEPTNAPPEYRLSAGDVIELKFFYDPELNDSVQIRPDGLISLPLVGEINLKNKTPGEATRELELLYSKSLKTPSITLQVRSFGGQKVYVGGEVNRPGTVNLMNDLSVLEVMMDAGGAKTTASKFVLLLRRSSDNRVIVQKISLVSHNNQPSEAVLTRVRPFDVVLVPESKIAHADRWVDQHIRQLVPATMAVGFSYLFNGTVIP